MAGKKNVVRGSTRRKTRRNPTKSPLSQGLDMKGVPIIKKDESTQDLFPSTETYDDEDVVSDEQENQPTLSQAELVSMAQQYVPGLDGDEVPDDVSPIDLEPAEDQDHEQIGDGTAGGEEDEEELEGDVGEDNIGTPSDGREPCNSPMKEPENPVTPVSRKRKGVEEAGGSGPRKAKSSKLQLKKSSRSHSKATNDKIRKVDKAGLGSTKYTQSEVDHVKNSESKKRDVLTGLRGQNTNMTDVEMQAISDFLSLNPHKTSIDMGIFVDGFRQHASMFNKQREAALQKAYDKQTTLIKEQEELIRKLTRLVDSLSAKTSNIKKEPFGQVPPTKPPTAPARDLRKVNPLHKEKPESSRARESVKRSDFSLGQQKVSTPHEEDSTEEVFAKYVSMSLMDLDDLDNYGGVSEVMNDFVKVCKKLEPKWRTSDGGMIDPAAMRQSIYSGLSSLFATKQRILEAKEAKEALIAENEKKKSPSTSKVPRGNKATTKEKKRVVTKKEPIERAVDKGKKKMKEKEPIQEVEDVEEESEEYDEEITVEGSDSLNLSGSEDGGSEDEGKSSSG